MKLSLSMKSVVSFLVAVLFLVLLTLFESSLTGLSLTTERILSFLLLVVPAVIGTIFGVSSLVQKEPHPWLGILGILLNGLFALFHLFLLSFAG